MQPTSNCETPSNEKHFKTFTSWIRQTAILLQGFNEGPHSDFKVWVKDLNPTSGFQWRTSIRPTWNSRHQQHKTCGLNEGLTRSNFKLSMKGELIQTSKRSLIFSCVPTSKFQWRTSILLQGVNESLNPHYTEQRTQTWAKTRGPQSYLNRFQTNPNPQNNHKYALSRSNKLQTKTPKIVWTPKLQAPKNLRVPSPVHF